MRVRTEHWALLLDLGEKTPELLTNKFNGAAGKARGHALWQSTTEKLNSLGFGTKSVEEWRRALTDWKSKTKAKAAKLRQERESTGGGLAIAIPLTDMENRLLAIMGNIAVDGDFGVKEFGVRFTHTENVIEAEHVEIAKTVGTTESTPTLLDHDHSYLKRKSNGTTPKSKRIRENANLRMSRELLDKNDESLNILRNIDINIKSIADSLIIAQKLNP